MESDFAPVKEVDGINLDNYFPHRSSFNTVIYVHKRFLKKPKPPTEALREETVKKKRKVKKKIVKEDKAISCDIKDSKSKREGRHESVLQQTIKFAKDLAPLVIPPSEGNDIPVFYTIKTSTKKKDHDEKCGKHDDSAFEKKRSKKLIETFKHEKKNYRESYSAYSATNSSQSNFLDDDTNNINQSLSYTLSELSDKKEKYHKNEFNSKRKRRDSNKFHVSESFAGLAELNDAGKTAIKINLMNEKEKYLLSESIRVPVLDAVKDCVKEFNDTEMKEDVTRMQRLVQHNSQKLDLILEKLTCIEQYLGNAHVRTPRSPKSKVKASKLEQLGEDLMKEKEYDSEEELPKSDTNRQGNEVTMLMQGDRVAEDLGCGEIPENRQSTSVGVRADRRRIPARFCWTDAARNNVFD